MDYDYVDRFSPFPRLVRCHTPSKRFGFLGGAASTFSLGSSDRRATQSFSTVNSCFIRAGPVSGTRKLSKNGARGDERHHRFTNKMDARDHKHWFGVPP